MISKRYITQWTQNVSWLSSGQIEQDLIISRALINLFENKVLRESLVFRGGTALNKLFFSPPLRYSEDIDLVQFKAGSIGILMTSIHEALDPWLGKPKYKQTNGRVTFYYKFKTEGAPVKEMKLKVEINTREHGSVFDVIEKPFIVENGWFSGGAHIKTYALEELMATKLRALYQRRKGRDLFDLYQGIAHYPNIDIGKILKGFSTYMNWEDCSVRRAEFEENMHQKLQNEDFLNDMIPLLPANVKYNSLEAYNVVHDHLISNLDGKEWKEKEKLV